MLLKITTLSYKYFICSYLQHLYLQIQIDPQQFITHLPMQTIDNKVVIGSLFGFGLAALAGAAIYRHFVSEEETLPKKQYHESQYKTDLRQTKTIVLLGDVGGTNIRLKLIELSEVSYDDTKVLKEQKLKTANFQQFYLAIEHFLEAVELRPTICVVAIAGPVNNNSILMSNVQKWGLLDGPKLASHLKINRFVFLNDFEANAYGLMTLKDKDIIKLNGLDPINYQNKLIIGPGTGLGTCSLVAVPNINGNNKDFVVPGEGGHIGFAPSNDEQAEYYSFLKKHFLKPMIVLQACFCGPAIPYMYKFFAQKFPFMQGANDISLTAEEIMRIGVQNPNSLHRKAVNLFLDIYENVIGDQMLRKLCYGGFYLIGSITKSVLPLIEDPSFNWLQNYKSHRPYLKHVFDRIPLVVVKEPGLAQRGAFVFAKKLLN